MEERRQHRNPYCLCYDFHMYPFMSQESSRVYTDTDSILTTESLDVQIDQWHEHETQKRMDL